MALSEEVLATIDPLIKDLIIRLNGLGFTTTFSCQGKQNSLYDEDTHSLLAYVAFKEPLPNELCYLIVSYPLSVEQSGISVHARSNFIPCWGDTFEYPDRGSKYEDFNIINNRAFVKNFNTVLDVWVAGGS